MTGASWCDAPVILLIKINYSLGEKWRKAV
jgi:hypothetical protein